MKTYTTKQKVKSGGKYHLPGEAIELDAKQAEELKKIGAIEDGAPEAEEEKETMLLGSSKLPAEIEIADGVKMSLGDLVQFVFEGTGIKTKDWNELSDEDREAFLERGRQLLTAVHQAGAKNNGKAPSVNEVKKLAGFDLDAKAKDAAWAMLESLKEPAGKK